MKTENLDIVLPYKKSETEELKYCLRSLENLPHRNLYIIGEKENWFSEKVNYRRVPGVTHLYKYENTMQNIVYGTKIPEVSENFILMNDDFFILKKITKLEYFHTGEMNQNLQERFNRLGNTQYNKAISDTVALLRTMYVEKPLNYSLHLPMIVSKTGIQLVNWLTNTNHSEIYLSRSIYGNIFIKKSKKIERDVKINNLDEIPEKNQAFVSTGDDSFANGEIGKFLKRKFNKKSSYEK